MCAPDQAQIRRDVLSYLIDNADAQDTLEGIVEWWLLERRIKRQTVEVKKVIADLAAREMIVSRKTRDARTHYRVNHRKQKEILALLKKKKD
jgi:hypothetical protein